MAEAAGLALGAVALIGTFKDCVDLFSMISSARSFGRDYELLDTKLDVEKTLFLQWAERVRLVKTPYDSHLDDPVIQGTVTRILASIQLLLSESRSLQHRYGLRQLESHESFELQPSISGPRMRRFIQEFSALNLRISEHRQNVSNARQIRWVICDKEKFGGLVQELSYFISRLNDIVPVATISSRAMVHEDLAQQPSLRALFLIRDASLEHRQTVAELAEETVQSLILRALWFRRIDDREEDIKSPHLTTLAWALDPPRPDFAWDSLSDWFRSGSGIYWLSGKPGSGKSTLMKFIHRHNNTQELLQQWAQCAPLTTASFFFWHLGTLEQKTQNGLSRALLYKVLNSDKALIQKLLPKMWDEAHESDDGKLALPSPAEMRTAFEKLGAMENMSQKYCFFIDGLDEYTGDLKVGIDFIKKLASTPNIKVLVSSRPLSALVDGFTGRPRLRLQDLTKNDIATYVCDTIGSHSYMSGLRETDPTEAAKISNDIVEKASGVFLWVVLACKSLLDGFAAFDRITDLQRRVDELPPELEDLFQHILQRIELRYRHQAAKLLRIRHQSYVVEGAEELSSLGLAIVDESEFDVNREPDFHKLNQKAKKDKCRMLEGRLRSRCCGLLEIRPAFHDHEDICFCAQQMHDPLIDSTVVFLHRSVFEFLEMPGIWDLECLQIVDDNFEPNAVLSRLSLHLAQLSLDGQVEQTSSYIGDIFLYATASDCSGANLAVTVLRQVEDVVRDFGAKDASSTFFKCIRAYPRWGFTKIESQMAFLLAIEAGLTNAASQFTPLRDLLTCRRSEAFPFLYHAIHRPLFRQLSSWQQEISPAMIELLLSSGFDPNEPFMSLDQLETTPWKEFLRLNLMNVANLSASEYVRLSDCALAFMNADASMSNTSLSQLSSFTAEQAVRPGDRRRTIVQAARSRLLQCITCVQEAQHMQDQENSRLHPSSTIQRSLTPLELVAPMTTGLEKRLLPEVEGTSTRLYKRFKEWV